MGYETSGRTNQKTRTRSALIAAARELITRQGAAPTIDEAATLAGISRTTAYRYFPSQRALLVAAHPEVEAASMLPPAVGSDPEQRLLAAVTTFVEMIDQTEAQQRTMLRLSLEDAPESQELPLRQGRAVGWFEEALSVLRPELSAAEVRRVAIAVRSVTGIETRVWLRDVGGLSAAQVNRQLVWNARAVLALARQDGPPKLGRRS